MLISLIASVILSSSPDAGVRTKPCTAAAHRQFDFWLGNWNVTLPDGNLAGTNRIEAILDGCVLHESWAGAKGLRGQSYNIYDATTERWHQTWVDAQGTRLELSGSFVNGKMVLIGTGAKGIQNRITWEPLKGGKVRQLWESSTDGGRTWSMQFDGLYVKQS